MHGSPDFPVDREAAWTTTNTRESAVNGRHATRSRTASTECSSAGDWRIPSIQDWIDYHAADPQDDSVLKPTCPDGSPNIPNAADTGCWTPGNPFTNVQAHGYHTSTTVAGQPTEFRYVELGNGNNATLGKLDAAGWTTAVRGGR